MSENGVLQILNRLEEMRRSHQQDRLEMAERMEALERRVAAIPEIFEKCKSHCVVANPEQLVAEMTKALRKTGSDLPVITNV
jgi:hypothetical protein